MTKLTVAPYDSTAVESLERVRTGSEVADKVIACNHFVDVVAEVSPMASITIRNLSAESKARLRRRADQRGCSLEALVRSILDTAAEEAAPTGSFPHNLITLVELGEDVEPFIREHRQLQEPVDLA